MTALGWLSWLEGVDSSARAHALELERAALEHMRHGRQARGIRTMRRARAAARDLARAAGKQAVADARATHAALGFARDR
jgi:hypothetical protein